jgi:serine/threonine protein kinase
MAPEILDKKNCSKKGYNPELSDIFSLGIIFFIMNIGKPPFRQADPYKDEIYRLIATGNYSKFWMLWEN